MSDVTANVSSVGASGSTTRVRAVTIASVGNILEWFDFTVYGLVAVIMAKHFFPNADATVALLASFATFGVGFVTRPVGAIVFGRLGDVRGRKFVLLLSMFMMAGGSFLMGIAPTYATIGVLAPILIVVARLLQGFSAGGEFGSAAAFLIEWAPEGRRGFYGSFHQVGTSGGLLVGSLLLVILSAILPPPDIEAWGWRIPFLLGGALAIVAMYMRRRVDETPKFRAIEAAPAAVAPAAAEPILKPLLQNVGIVTLWTVSVFATIVFMPTFTQKFAGLTRADALWATTVAIIVNVLAIPLAGHLSDKIGRKPVIMTAAVGFAVLSVPLFNVIVSGASLVMIAFVQSVFAFLSALNSGPGPAAISELFTTRQRSTLVSVGVAIAVVVFGGFAPFIATILIEKTGTPIAPAYYVVACALITGLTVLTMRETAKQPLR
jgi:MFS transporter, MHS family, proline/betaine transporter